MPRHQPPTLPKKPDPPVRDPAKTDPAKTKNQPKTRTKIDVDDAQIEEPRDNAFKKP